MPIRKENETQRWIFHIKSASAKNKKKIFDVYHKLSGRSTRNTVQMVPS
jgi:hypothetical protein